MKDLFETLGLDFDPNEELNKFDEHLSKREQLDHDLSISILKNKVWYWESIRAKLCETRYPERFKIADDNVKKLTKSIQKLKQ